MTAPLPALVALRDAVQALTAVAQDGFPYKHPLLQALFDTRMSDAESDALLRSLKGDLNASERLRMALLPGWHPRTAKLPNEDDGWEAELWDPETCLLICATGPVESIARTLAVLNALIGKERE